MGVELYLESIFAKLLAIFRSGCTAGSAQA